MMPRLMWRRRSVIVYSVATRLMNPITTVSTTPAIRIPDARPSSASPNNPVMSQTISATATLSRTPLR